MKTDSEYQQAIDNLFIKNAMNYGELNLVYSLEALIDLEESSHKMTQVVRALRLKMEANQGEQS
jgi:hypothetical protein